MGSATICWEKEKSSPSSIGSCFLLLALAFEQEVVAKAPKSTQASPEVVSGIEVGSDAMPKVSLVISSIAVAESW